MNKDLLKVIGNSDELERMVLKLRDDKYVQMWPDYPKQPDGKKDMTNGLFNL